MTKYDIKDSELLNGVKEFQRFLVERSNEFENITFVRWFENNNPTRFLIVEISKNGEERFIEFDARHYDALCHFPLNINTFSAEDDRRKMTESRQELIEDTLTRRRAHFK